MILIEDHQKAGFNFALWNNSSPGGESDAVQLYDIAEDPTEARPLALGPHGELVARLQAVIMQNYPTAVFPATHENVEAAFPGNNNGNLVTGWC